MMTKRHLNEFNIFFPPSASKSNPVHIEEPKISGGRKKACLGGSVNLICNMLDTEGIFWKKDGHEIRSERHAWKQNNTHGARGVKFYLEITNVTKSDEGFYECDGIKNGLPYTSTKKLFLGTGNSSLMILLAILPGATVALLISLSSAMQQFC